MLDAAAAVAKQSDLETKRANFDSKWQEAAELFLPRQADFPWNMRRSEGEDRSNQVIDEYGQDALDDGVSVFQGFVMPAGSLWQLLQAPEELKRYQHVREWFERKTLRLFALRNDPMSGWSGQVAESIASLMCFGNQSMDVELRFDPMTRAPIGVKYRSEHIGGVWIEQDWQGIPFRFHKKFRWTAEQARQFFGDEKLQRAPKVLEAATDPKKRSNEFEFLRTCEVNYNVDHDRMDWRGKPYMGGFISIGDKEYVQQGGWNSNPSTYSRFYRSPNETYGRGPGTKVLPSVKSAQAIMLDMMVGAEMSLMPPLGASDDMQDQQIIYGAREITYGAIDHRGNPTVQRLFEVGDMNPALMIQQRIEKVIDRAFFRHMLSVLNDLKSHVTDAQLYDRKQEKGILLQPLSRQEEEWFTPMNMREVDLMAQLGEFDDMPHEVREAGGARAMKYDNPLNRMIRSEQASGYFRTLDKVTAVAQYKPEALDIFFTEFPLDKAVRGIAEIEAVPASWAATDSEKEAAEEARFNAAQAQQALEALPEVARAAKDLSQAGAANVA